MYQLYSVQFEDSFCPYTTIFCWYNIISINASLVLIFLRAKQMVPGGRFELPTRGF